MTAPSEPHIKSTLEAYEKRIAALILRAWETWRTGKLGERYVFKRTRACLVHEDMVREARAEFAGDRDVHIIPGPETIYILIRDAVTIRLKKGDARGLGRNNHTQTSFAFVSADADPFELPLGLPDVQRADVTYLLNELETKIDEILVAGRDGARRLWAYAIYPRIAKPVDMLPVAPTAPVNPADVVRVPGRRDEKKDAG